jgi:hypothetical protein
MKKRIVPLLTATFNLITEVIENWDRNNAIKLLGDVVRHGDFQNTDVRCWKPILIRCEDYLKDVSNKHMVNFVHTGKFKRS